MVMGNIERQSILFLFFLSITFHSLAENEPNGTFSQANEIELNKEAVGKIQSRGDNDYFKFNIPSGGFLQIDITNISRDFVPELILYDKNEKYIDGISGQVTSLSIREFVCEPGTYYIRFHAKRDRNYSRQEYKINIAAGLYDTYECNNTLETASIIGLNQEIVAAIQNKGDIDYYALDLGESGILSMQVKRIPENIQAKIELFDPVDSVVIHSEVVDSMATSSLFKGMICRKGRYYIVISDLDNDEFSFDQYELTLSQKKIDPNECNNKFEDATKIKIGETLKGFIEVKGDPDFYTFSNPGVGLVTAKISSVSANIAPHILVYDSEKELIKELSGKKSDESLTLEFTTCSDNDYFIVFQDKEETAEDEDNPYDLVLSHETLEKYECNNTMKTATSIDAGSVIRANIRPAGDFDFYSLTLHEKQNYKLSLDLIPDSIDIIAGLYVEGSDDPIFEEKRTKGDSISKEFIAPETGVFYLKLEDEGGDNFSTSDYYLLIEKEIITKVTEVGNTTNELRVYPNPSQDVIIVTGLKDKEGVLVVDIAGKVVLRSKNAKIDISNLESGMYFVRTKNKSSRFIKP